MDVQKPVYVTGHKNPDTDSIISAIAYAALMNALGDRRYIAARLGTVSDETTAILERFGVPAPQRIYNVRTQVRDLNFDRPPVLSRAVTVHRAWEAMLSDTREIPALPVADDEGGLRGMVSAGDIAAFDLASSENMQLKDIPLFNIVSNLDGQLWGGNSALTALSGELKIALPEADPERVQLRRDMILVTGSDPAILRRAIEAKVACVVVSNAPFDPSVAESADDTLFITTPFDAYRAARLIIQSVPVERALPDKDKVAFHLDDYLDDVRDQTLKSRFRSYPILDENDRVVGTLSRFHLLRPNRKQVVLVDHNELSQSVDGLNEAEILAIIDHHRLADVQTGAPIYVRNEPVGATCTIVASMFQERGVMPNPQLAGLLAAGIVSDTIYFKSPTATPRDRLMAERMAAIANVTLADLGRAIFSPSASRETDPEKLLLSDFKHFEIEGHKLGIGQISCIDSAELLERRDAFLEAMERVRAARSFDMLLLMLTDVLKEGTVLLCCGGTDTVEEAFNVKVVDNTAFLPGVLSRKKQIVPALSVLWG
ncbi:MAG: putative manganese-dependent inorganic diphosphatase [Clostridia bacterium]|jgi:manganese-dependent inorganic pyrophosphatase|nr:putative manganese-dependent inorganic diphosphatase [Clostridia bacterium]MBR3037404.1 putative manganese-dependent inorganic diphosphatase [Clostridia bacterium]